MASDKIIARKEAEVQEIASQIKDSASVIVVHYKGLKMKDMSALRKELVENDIEFKVLKNNLVRRAAKSLDMEYLCDHLTGANALAFSKNIVEPAKILNNYAKDFDFFEIKGGVIDNEYADAAVIQSLASIPNMEGLLGMIAGGLLSPIRELAIGLNMLTEGESDFAFPAE